MFINKLNQLYKPDRVLYYIEADDESIKEFYSGKVPEVLKRYDKAMGTYDAPGVFYIDALKKSVFGIEFREGDGNIAYPKELQSIHLNEAFFYSVEIDNDVNVDRDFIRDIFGKIAENDDAHRLFSDLVIKKEPSVISIFSDGKKIRILHEWEVLEDRAKSLIEERAENFDKEYLFKNSFFDPVTKHYNWNHLAAYLEMPMDKGIKDYAFVHFDIKEFRVLNEVYGHVAANKVLSNVVKAMNESEYVYTSARCHNDNFAMMIKDMPKEETKAFLEEFFEGISHIEEDPNYKVYYRCGVVLMPRSLLMGNRVADAAKMAQALGNRPNKTEITIYSDKMHEDISWSNFIKAYVETAINNDEFVVYLQPKINSKTNKLKGAEALVRWNYKKKEFLSPARFIPFFEKDGSIGKIDDIVLEKVCEALSKWKDAGKELFPISVNLSRNRMFDKDLIRHLTQIVDRYGVDHELIDFELTESATYDNTEHMIHVLYDLRENGFKISMDDFGTGYSSLALLTKMPIDTLKIDKSFVDGIGIDDERIADITVVRHIISLCSELGFSCLAEGAETLPQVERLFQLGCETIQGYYYSKPISIEEFEKKYL